MKYKGEKAAQSCGSLKTGLNLLCSPYRVYLVVSLSGHHTGTQLIYATKKASISSLKCVIILFSETKV